jgi:hypothetical protein
MNADRCAKPLKERLDGIRACGAHEDNGDCDRAERNFPECIGDVSGHGRNLLLRGVSNGGDEADSSLNNCDKSNSLLVSPS